MCWEPRCQATRKAATSGCTGWNICELTMIIGARHDHPCGAVHGGGRLLLQLPVGREKDGVPLCGRVSPCRVRNGKLGQEDVVRRGEVEQRGCLRLWLRRHTGHGGVPRRLHRADGFAQGAFPLGRQHGRVSYGVRDRCQVHHQAAWGCAIRSTG